MNLGCLDPKPAVLVTEIYCLKYYCYLEEFPLRLPKTRENSSRGKDEAIAESSVRFSRGEKSSYPEMRSQPRALIWVIPDYFPPPPLTFLSTGSLPKRTWEQA